MPLDFFLLSSDVALHQPRLCACAYTHEKEKEEKEGSGSLHRAGGCRSVDRLKTNLSRQHWWSQSFKGGSVPAQQHVSLAAAVRAEVAVGAGKHLLSESVCSHSERSDSSKIPPHD